MDRKEAEKELCLYLNVLSRMALGKDVDVTIVDEGQGTHANIGTGKIYIEECSQDKEILLGLGFHELAHVLATSAIDYHSEFKIPEADCRALHAQMKIGRAHV